VKTLLLSLALLAVAAAGPALGGELQMATSEMNNADAAPDQNKTSISRNIAGRTIGAEDRLEANVMKKQQLRAAGTGGAKPAPHVQVYPFEIQTKTSDLHNAENVP
jgi:hypothetical protein